MLACIYVRMCVYVCVCANVCMCLCVRKHYYIILQVKLLINYVIFVQLTLTDDMTSVWD